MPVPDLSLLVIGQPAIIQYIRRPHGAQRMKSMGPSASSPLPDMQGIALLGYASATRLMVGRWAREPGRRIKKAANRQPFLVRARSISLE
jgi:hypothetical protein